MAYFIDQSGKAYETTSGNAHNATDKSCTAKVAKEMIRAQAKQHLLEVLNPGQTVYTVLRHTSKSGMSRSISVFIIQDGEIKNLDHWIATAQGTHIDENNGGIKIRGCGMDMGFHLVYNIGAMLWPNGTPKPHGIRNGQDDSAGGYALKQQWM